MSRTVRRPGQPLHQATEGLDLVAGESLRRLVEDEQLGPEHEGHGHLQDALVPVGQGSRALARGAAGQPDSREDGLHVRRDRGRVERDPVERRTEPAALGGEGHVVVDGQATVDARDLEGVDDAEHGTLPRPEPR